MPDPDLTDMPESRAKPHSHALAESQKRDPSWLKPSGRVGAVAKELQGFGAPALLLDTLELAASLRTRGRGISAAVDGAAHKGA